MYKVFSIVTGGHLGCDAQETTLEAAKGKADAIRDRYAAMRITCGVIVRDDKGKEVYRTSWTV